jgi:hypothetical protein
MDGGLLLQVLGEGFHVAVLPAKGAVPSLIDSVHLCVCCASTGTITE